MSDQGNNMKLRDDQAQLKQEMLIFERGGSGRVGCTFPRLDVPEVDPVEAWGEDAVRGEIAGFPEVSEVDVVRHFTRISQHNFGIESGLFPLGSCTMKYNPKVNERVVRSPGFASAHPYMPSALLQGSLDVMRRLEEALAAVTGMDRVTLQPAAGAQGELTGIMMIAAYHAARGDTQRRKVLIPDSAHGTNPATAAFCGFDPVEIPSNSRGTTDIEALRAKADDTTAALMLTNPNTLGLFEDQMEEIAEIMHGCGAQIYCDGANLNAILGKARPGDIGIDAFHINLHKTFAIPHGGGGPGMGPIGVLAHLAPFLPDHPIVEGGNPAAGGNPTIGTISSAPWGSASILPISWAYIAMLGASGLRRATEIAILNANYIAKRLHPHYPVVYRGTHGLVAHECSIDLRPIKADTEISVEDVAKRLIDYGFHAPTMSWPVPDTFMIEPTESESKEEIDRFVDAMIAIRSEIAEIESGEADRENNLLCNAPHSIHLLTESDWNYPYPRERAFFPTDNTRRDKYWPPVGRVDSVSGDRNLVCTCPPIEYYEQEAA